MLPSLLHTFGTLDDKMASMTAITFHVTFHVSSEINSHEAP
jgi:hypothetical protein